MSDYRNLTYRLLDIGLNLTLTNDKVSEGKWLALTNVNATQEGGVGTRDGRSILITTPVVGAVHTIKRIGTTTLLVGVAGSIFRNGTLLGTGFSGRPLFPIPTRPPLSSTTWTYIADGTQLKKVRDDGTFWKWGITAPTNAATLTAVGSGNLDSSVAGAIVYDWRYTYYSTATGSESNPSPTVGGIAAIAKQGQISVTASIDPQIDQIRIYRRGGANGGDAWRFTVSSGNVSGTVTDNNADSSIALNNKLLLDNDVPFTSVDSAGNTLVEVPLPYAAGPFVGKYILATGDPNRPGYVYWTNSERPDSAAVSNNVQVTNPQEPLVGVLVFSALAYTFSREDLYLLDFGGPNALPVFTPRRTPTGLGAVGPRAFCVGDMIYFVNRRGVYSTDGQSAPKGLSEDAIRPLFQGQTIGSFSPIDFTQSDAIRLCYTGELLHFFYIDTLGVTKHLTYSLVYQRWKDVVVNGLSTSIAYQDENQASTRVLFGESDGNVYLSDPSVTTDNGGPIGVNVRTGQNDFQAPQTYKEFGNIILDADPQGGTITITPLLNYEVSFLPSFTASGTGRQKFTFSLSDTFAYALGFNLSWTGPAKIFQFDILWRMDEESITHWEVPPGANGFVGWQHIRDAYIVLRSSAPTTFTLEVDGVPYTYSIPSTSGLKVKNYVQLSASKGKLFRYSLDSSLPFRVYGDDCEIRSKSWNTKFGYQLSSPFVKLGSDGTK